MTDEPFVDVHVHFWDHAEPGLHWPWLEPGFTHRALVDTHTLDAPRYIAPEFRAEAEGAGVGGLVHTQAVGTIDDPSLETAWLQRVADEHGLPSAIVGSCVLSSPGAGDLLRRHATYDRLRGVRDITSSKSLDADASAAALDVADELGLGVELRRAPADFAVLDEIAGRWPGITLTLSHACLPLERTEADRREWEAALRLVARHPNVACKISAVAGASDPHWTIDSIRPWILTCVDVFGPDRCMLGTNWPVDRLFGTYVDLVAAYREVVAELAPAERAAVLGGTARRLYRLPD